MDDTQLSLHCLSRSCSTRRVAPWGWHQRVVPINKGEKAACGLPEVGSIIVGRGSPETWPNLTNYEGYIMLQDSTDSSL